MLFEKGLHPNVICRGYHEASQMAVEYLHTNISRTSDEREILVSVAKTAITGKALENSLDAVAELCVAAVEKAGDAESVKVVSFPGGSLDDSYLYEGSIVNKDYVLEGDDAYSNIVLLNTGLENEALSLSVMRLMTMFAPTSRSTTSWLPAEHRSQHYAL